MGSPPTTSGKDVDIRLRIERAKKHIVDLNTAIVAFNATGPYEVGAKRDPDTRKPIYYVKEVKPTPAEFSLIAGDAIQNLRSSLDHLAWLLVKANGGTPGDSTQFPIYKDLKKYESQKP